MSVRVEVGKSNGRWNESSLYIRTRLSTSCFSSVSFSKDKIVSFIMLRLATFVTALAASVAAHGDHDHVQEPLAGPLQSLWYNQLPGDGGKQVRSAEQDCYL